MDDHTCHWPVDLILQDTRLWELIRQMCVGVIEMALSVTGVICSGPAVTFLFIFALTKTQPSSLVVGPTMHQSHSSPSRLNRQFFGKTALSEGHFTQIQCLIGIFRNLKKLPTKQERQTPSPRRQRQLSLFISSTVTGTNTQR